MIPGLEQITYAAHHSQFGQQSATIPLSTSILSGWFPESARQPVSILISSALFILLLFIWLCKRKPPTNWTLLSTPPSVYSTKAYFHPSDADPDGGVQAIYDHAIARCHGSPNDGLIARLFRSQKFGVLALFALGPWKPRRDTWRAKAAGASFYGFITRPHCAMLGLATVCGPEDPSIVLGLDRILVRCERHWLLRPIVASAASHELVHVAQEIVAGALTFEWRAASLLRRLLLFLLAPFCELHAYLLFPLSILTAASALVIFASLVFGLPSQFIAG